MGNSTMCCLLRQQAAWTLAAKYTASVRVCELFGILFDKLSSAYVSNPLQMIFGSHILNGMSHVRMLQILETTRRHLRMLWLHCKYF